MDHRLALAGLAHRHQIGLQSSSASSSRSCRSAAQILVSVSGRHRGLRSVVGIPGHETSNKHQTCKRKTFAVRAICKVMSDPPLERGLGDFRPKALTINGKCSCGFGVEPTVRAGSERMVELDGARAYRRSRARQQRLQRRPDVVQHLGWVSAPDADRRPESAPGCRRRLPAGRDQRNVVAFRQFAKVA